MDMSEIGIVLVLFIVIYFLFRVGIRLYYDDLGDMKFWAWTFAVIGGFWGFSELNKTNPLGFLGFIPLVSYIVLQLSSNFNFDYSTKKKIKSVLLSIISMVATYIITHALFGFGIPEASISAVVAAGVLGIAGYTA